MSKDRERPCIHYICEKECALGKEGTFRNKCQKCKTYKASKKGNVRGNYRREKEEKYRRDKRTWE